MTANKKPRLSGASFYLKKMVNDGECFFSTCFVNDWVLLFLKHTIQLRGEKDPHGSLKRPVVLSLIPNFRFYELLRNLFNRHLIVTVKAVVFPKINHRYLHLLKNGVRFPTTQPYFIKWVFSLFGVSGVNQALSKIGPLILLGKENA